MLLQSRGTLCHRVEEDAVYDMEKSVCDMALRFFILQDEETGRRFVILTKAAERTY